MKLALSILLLFPVLVTASTEIVYNRSTNPFVPKDGKVTEERICLETTTNSWRVNTPAKQLMVSRFTKQKVCVKWDHTDSKYPKCLKWEMKDSEHSNTFTEMTYEPSDWHRERPLRVIEKTIDLCPE